MHKITDVTTEGGITGLYSTLLTNTQLTGYMFYKYNSDRILNAYNKLADYESKYEYKKYIQNILEGNMLFASIRNNKQYWGNDIINDFQDGDSVLNAGAYDGADLDRALAINPNITVHAVEPCQDNIDRLAVKYSGLDNVFIYAYGLGERAETSYLSADGAVGKRVKKPDGENAKPIKIERLDNIIKTPVNYIALDIEGDEILALKGASKIINTYKPTLAISSYHKIPHIVDVLEAIEDICPGYTFFFRHYSSIMTESVLYAKYVIK